MNARCRFAEGWDPSALRLVTAVDLQITAIWSDRRCLDMSMLKSKEVVIAKAA